MCPRAQNHCWLRTAAVSGPLFSRGSSHWGIILESFPALLHPNSKYFCLNLANRSRIWPLLIFSRGTIIFHSESCNGLLTSLLTSLHSVAIACLQPILHKAPERCQKKNGATSFSCFTYISVASLCTKNLIQTYHLGLEAPAPSALPASPCVISTSFGCSPGSRTILPWTNHVFPT